MTGPFNVTDPAEILTMQQLLESCRNVYNREAFFTWVGESFLINNNVVPFTGMPLWVPEEDAGILQVDIGRALRAGLSFRPLLDTVRDTLAWSQTRPKGYEWRGGITSQLEMELLEQWHAS